MSHDPGTGEQVLPDDTIEPSCGRCDAGWLWTSALGNHLCGCEWGERAGGVESDHAAAKEFDRAPGAHAAKDAAIEALCDRLALSWGQQ